MTSAGRVGRTARLLGFAGLLPQAAAMAALAFTDWRFTAGVMAFGYATIILSFLGGTWWGLAARAESPPAWMWGAAVTPSLIGLLAIAMLIAFHSGSDIAALLLVGVALLLSPLVDAMLSRAGLAPTGWMALRLPLSLGLGSLTIATTVVLALKA